MCHAGNLRRVRWVGAVTGLARCRSGRLSIEMGEGWAGRRRPPRYRVARPMNDPQVARIVRVAGVRRRVDRQSGAGTPVNRAVSEPGLPSVPGSAPTCVRSLSSLSRSDAMTASTAAPTPSSIEFASAIVNAWWNPWMNAGWNWAGSWLTNASGSPLLVTEGSCPRAKPAGGLPPRAADLGDEQWRSARVRQPAAGPVPAGVHPGVPPGVHDRARELDAARGWGSRAGRHRVAPAQGTQAADTRRRRARDRWQAGL